MAIGVSPAILELNLDKNQPASREIFLQNLDPQTTKVQVTVENAKLNKFIRIDPEEALLPPQVITPVKIIVTPKKSFETQLKIQNLASLNGGLEISSGIYIPLKVEVKNSTLYFSPVALALVFALLTVGIVYLIERRKLRKLITT